MPWKGKGIATLALTAVLAMSAGNGASQTTAPTTPPTPSSVETERDLVPELNLDRVREGAKGNRKSPAQRSPGQRIHEFAEAAGAMEIIAGLNITTRIVLDPSESIVDITFGDPSGWNYEMSSANTVDLQPLFSGTDTNLHIRTESERYYQFALIAVGFDHPYKPDELVFVLLWNDGSQTNRHANPHAKARDAREVESTVGTRLAAGWGPDPVDEVSGTVTSSFTATGEPRRWDDPWNPNYNGLTTLRELHENTVRGPTAQEFFGNLRTAVSDPSNMTWDGYAVYLSDERAISIAPTKVWNDGTHTILEFPERISQLPTVQHLHGGIERPTNTTPIGGSNARLQVDIVGSLVLRLGEMVVCVTYTDPFYDRRQQLTKSDTRSGWLTLNLNAQPLAHPALPKTMPSEAVESKMGAVTSGFWQPIITDQTSWQPQQTKVTATTEDKPDSKGEGEFTVVLTGPNWTAVIPSTLEKRARGSGETGEITNIPLDRAVAICQEAGTVGTHCEIR